MSGHYQPDRLKVSATVGGDPGSDEFYDKFINFNQSSGLSLVFNFREANMDLYQFYKEVTQRGGFYQVTNDEKWEEVALALSSRSRISMSMTQIQKIYASLLYQFEQTYYYPTSPIPNQFHQNGALLGRNFCTGKLSTIGKRKYCDGILVNLPTKNALHTGVEQKTNLPIQKPPKPKVKEIGKDRDAPVGLRSAYQLFLKMECDRLKKLHGESSGCLIRDMTIKAWGNLSRKDRQPYFEASKNDRERYNREMAEYNERKSKQISTTKDLSADKKSSVIDFTRPSEEEGDYHVTLPHDSEKIDASDQSMLYLTKALVENRGNEPIFQISWDEYCGMNLDIPT